MLLPTGRRIIALVTAISLVISQQAAIMPLVFAGAPPTASFTITPGTGSVNTTFNFDASASTDPEGGVVEVRWDFENDSEFDTGFTTVKTADNTYETAGTKTIKLEVKDVEGQITATTQDLVVTATAPGNTAPTAVFAIDPANKQGNTATIFTFNASNSSDPEDPLANLLFAWDFENDGQLNTGFESNPQINFTFPSEGIFTVRLVVRDTAGDNGFATDQVTISNGGGQQGPQNSPPVADFSFSPATGDTTTQFTFDASASSDVETPAAQLEVQWDFENDGTPDTGFITQKTFAHTFTTTGVKNVKLSVRDGAGAITDLIKQLTVNQPPVPPGGNQPPTASCNINPASGDLNTDFDFDATDSNDPEDGTGAGSALEVRWDFDGNGTYDTNFSPTKEIQYRFSTPGNFTAIVEVKDTGNPARTDTGTCNVAVAGPNQAPTAFIVVTDPINLQGFTNVTNFQFDASNSSDPESNISQLEVSWDFGQGEGFTGFSTTKTASYTYPTSGTKTVTLLVRDPQGLVSPPATVQLTVADLPPNNTPPTAAFAINPADAQGNGLGNTTTVFNFDASGSSDAETPVANLTVRWDFDGNGTYETGFETGKTTTKTFAATGTYTVVLEVEDGGDLNGQNKLRRTVSHTVTVNDVGVPGGNNPPVPDFTIMPDTGDTTTLFVFDAKSSSDVEDGTGNGSLLQVRWDFENDGIPDTAYALTKSTTHIYPLAGTYNVKVEVKDTAGNESALVKPVTVTDIVITGPEMRTTSRALRRQLLYNNRAPQPVFTMMLGENEIDQAEVGQEVAFDATKSKDDKDVAGMMMYRWDFNGDGEFDTRFSLTHRQITFTYDQPGLQFVTLEAFDTYGARNNVTRLLAVIEKPQPPVVTPRERIELDQPAPAPVLTPAPVTPLQVIPAPQAPAADGRHTFLFAPYIEKRVLRHGERATLTTVLMNLTDRPVFDIRISEEQMPPTNGGVILRDRPRLDGSTFFPFVTRGTILGGDLVIAVLPPRATLKISYDIIASTAGIPESEQSYIGSIVRYLNGSKVFINSILLDNSKLETANADLSATPSLLSLSLAPLAYASPRRRREEEYGL